jgi:hypothetical protein
MSLETSLVSKRWTVTVEYDNESGDYVLPLSDEILKGLDWKIGDTLEWINNGDGSWTLRKRQGILTFITKYTTILRNIFIRSKNGNVR